MCLAHRRVGTPLFLRPFSSCESTHSPMQRGVGDGSCSVGGERLGEFGDRSRKGMPARRATVVHRTRCHFSTLLLYCAAVPSHEVLVMPALSPTMTQGTIVNWNMGPGDEFGPGDSFCEIETDKATVDFDVQDEGILAKILVEEGAEISVGTVSAHVGNGAAS